MIMTNKNNTKNQGNNSIRALVRISDKPEHMSVDEYRANIEEKLRRKYKTDEHTDVNISIVND